MRVGRDLQRNIPEHLQCRDHQGNSEDRLREEPYSRMHLLTLDCHPGVI